MFRFAGIERSEAQQVLAVVVLLERHGEGVDLFSRDVAHAVGDLFEAGDLEALTGLDGLNEGGCLQEGVVGAGVEPGVGMPASSILRFDQLSINHPRASPNTCGSST